MLKTCSIHEYTTEARYKIFKRLVTNEVYVSSTMHVGVRRNVTKKFYIARVIFTKWAHLETILQHVTEKCFYVVTMWCTFFICILILHQLSSHRNHRMIWEKFLTHTHLSNFNRAHQKRLQIVDHIGSPKFNSKLFNTKTRHYKILNALWLFINGI